MCGSKLRGSWSDNDPCGAVAVAGCVFTVGGCYSSKASLELWGALIGMDVVVVGGPSKVTAGAVFVARLAARAVSVESEVIDVEGVLMAEVEVEQVVRLKVEVDGTRTLEAVDIFAQLPRLLGRQFTPDLSAFTQAQPLHKPVLLHLYTAHHHTIVTSSTQRFCNSLHTSRNSLVLYIYSAVDYEVFMV